MPQYWNASQFLPEYLRLGLSDIVLVAHNWKEESRGYGDEEVTETIVARKGKGFVKVHAIAFHHFGWGAKTRRNVGEGQPISDSEYAQLVEGKKLIDTPEIRKEIEDEKTRLQRRGELQNQLYDIAPYCPVCGTRLAWRDGTYGPFWGCPRFKKYGCQGKARMTMEQLKIYKEFANT